MTDFVDKPFAPGTATDTYQPDQLIAGNLKLVTDTVTVTGGAAFPRGTVLGQITVGAALAAVKAGGNTGNGTFVLDATAPELTNVEPGVYTLRCISVGANGGKFRIENPKGVVLGDVDLPGTAGGSVTIAERIKGVLTDGSTDFVVGDGFDVTVAAAIGAYTIAKAAAIDGSAEPVAILVDAVDTTAADRIAGIYQMGEFNLNKVTLGAGITPAMAKAALQRRGIFLRAALTADDPS